ncbi:MAG: gamma-glutamyltransferase [Rhodospirillaceae bacterium]
MRHVHHGLNLQEAIDAPSFHSEHWPNSFYPHLTNPGRLVAESRFSSQTLEELKRRGHEVIFAPDWTEGRLSACAKDNTLLRAAANPRGMQGYAVGR